MVQPYVTKHPDSLEGRYLAGLASLATNRPEAAARHYGALRSRDPSKRVTAKLEALKAAYGDVLEKKVAQLACGETPIAGFYEAHESLLEDFQSRILGGAARLARKCVAAENLKTANEPGFWLIHGRGMDPEKVVNQLYAGPAAAALERRDAKTARLMTQQAVALRPEAAESLDPLFVDLRRDFETHQDALSTLCREIAQELLESQGSRGCVPATAPTAVAAFRDAWGHGLYYATHQSRNSACPRSLTLATWSPDSAPPDDPESLSEPTLVFTYRLGKRGCELDSTQDFWRARP
ncbi:MAG: hypothetical protein AAGD06_32405 [Acidobacteriota bacterium]